MHLELTGMEIGSTLEIKQSRQPNQQVRSSGETSSRNQRRQGNKGASQKEVPGDPCKSRSYS
jgi:hypothetical protein